MAGNLSRDEIEIRDLVFRAVAGTWAPRTEKRGRTTSLSTAASLDRIFYVCKTGCTWRCLEVPGAAPKTVSARRVSGACGPTSLQGGDRESEYREGGKSAPPGPMSSVRPSARSCARPSRDAHVEAAAPLRGANCAGSGDEGRTRPRRLPSGSVGLFFACSAAAPLATPGWK